MRVNVYAEEMTNRVELVTKEIDGRTYTGVRFYLYLPADIPDPNTMKPRHIRGPFTHHEGDDDSSAVTFWGKRDLRLVLRLALALLGDDADEAAR